MKKFKIMMQVELAVFFLGLLATSTVLADTTGGQFVDKDNRKYYIKDDHKAIYWHKIDGKMYYFDQDGVLQEFVGKQVLEAKTATNTNKHHGEQYDSPAEKRVYYFKDQNNYHTLKTGWVYDEGNWYYLQKDGGFDSRINRLTVGEIARGWINDDSTWYYLDPTTAAMQTGWKQLGNKWYYLRSSGAMATGWYQEGSTWYYLDQSNGDMKTGWQYLGNKWYYLRSSGAMVTGWVKDGSTWYYLNASNGDMKTGWTKVNGNWYYLNSSGAMVTGSQTIDGKVYNFGSSGEWI